MRAALAEARKGIGQRQPEPRGGGGPWSEDGADHLQRLSSRELDFPMRKSNALPRAGARFVSRPRSTSLWSRARRSARTPPCTEAIVRAGLGRVWSSGRQTRIHCTADARRDQMRASGIKVTTGVLAAECSRLNEAFNKWIVTGKPFVIAKCGMSLDGRLTRSPNEGRWLTSAAVAPARHATAGRKWTRS